MPWIERYDTYREKKKKKLKPHHPILRDSENMLIQLHW